MPMLSGFANTPVTKFLVAFIVCGALFSSATDTKYYFHLTPEPHLFGTPFSGQWWRLVTWPLCYTNSTEVLFGSLTFYQLRVVERLWGSRKFASFLITTLPYTVLVPPFLLLLARLLSGGRLNYLPAGPTSIAFALLAQYHAAIPYTFRYRVSASPQGADGPSGSSSHSGEDKGLVLTSKSISYLVPLQLALSQLPGSLIPAAVGWVTGYAWRAELLPVLFGRNWRIPGSLIGQGPAQPQSPRPRNTRARTDMDSLSRRMEMETGQTSGAQTEGSISGRRRQDVQ